MAKNLENLRKKKVKRINILLKRLIEKKPKRVTTSFAAFLKNYWKQVGNDPAVRNGGRVLKEAATAWNELSEKDRTKYEKAFQKDKARYEKEIAPWQVERRFLTKPAPPYALFTKDIWQREKSSGNLRGLTEMGRYVAQLWEQLSENDKKGYYERFERSQRRYNASIEDYKDDLLSENDFNRQLDVPEEYVSLGVPEEEQEDDEEDDIDEFGDD